MSAVHAVTAALRLVDKLEAWEDGDEDFGSSLAEQSYRKILSDKQLSAGLRMLRRSYGYIANGTLPTQTELEAEMYGQVDAPAGWVEAKKTRIHVSFNFDEVPFNRDWIDTIKDNVPDNDRRYNDGVWSIARSQAHVIVDLFPFLEIDDKTREWAEEAEADERLREELEGQAKLAIPALGDMSQPLWDTDVTLYDFQREGVRFLLKRGRGILADQMGLGKTYQSLAAARAIQEQFGHFVVLVVPAFLKDKWERDAGDMGLESYGIWSWAKQPHPSKIKGPFVLVGDEAHYAQSWDSKRSEAFRTLAKHPRCAAVFLLTGTPMRNGRPDNMGPLLDAIGHPIVDDIWSFWDRYCKEANSFSPRGWTPTGAKNLPEFYERTGDVVLQRKKTDVLDLPDLMRELMPVSLDYAASETYKSTLRRLEIEHQERVEQRAHEYAIEALREAYPEDDVDEDHPMYWGFYKERVARAELAEALTTMNRIRHAGSVAKTNAAVQLAMQVLDEDEQVVIFSSYKATVNAITEALNGKGHTARSLTSDTKDRDHLCDVLFQETGEVRALSCTHGAAGIGIDLYAAQTVILVDRPWTPGDAMQSEARLHRIGQDGTVTSIWLQLPPSLTDIDVSIDQLLLEKARNIERALEGKETKGGDLTNIADQIVAAAFRGGACEKDEVDVSSTV